jgi:putative two-component system response regulator
MNINDFFDARILVIDDEPSKVRLIVTFLGLGGYNNVCTETDPTLAAETFKNFVPDLVVLDLHMSPKDGFEILDEFGSLIPKDAYLPVLILTGDISTQTRERALAAGAMDFLAKPFSLTEILLRIKNLLHTRALHLALMAERTTLEARVMQRTAEVDQSQREILERLALVSEFRDDSTGNHTKRVAETVRLIALRMGLSGEEATMIAQASLLHDIGKVCIPDSILLKPGSLTPLEFEQIKGHAAIGGEILKGSQSRLLVLAESIARFHHERWDGSGYLGLEGTSIPLEARIVAVADVFDALTSARPYKPPWPPAAAVAELEESSGSQFDPTVIEAFLAVVPELLRVHQEASGSVGALRSFVTEGIRIPI